MSFDIGIYHFGENTPDAQTGAHSAPATRLAELVEQAEVADQAGLSVFGVGEHHRGDFTVSAPAVVLAAMAMRTQRIRLTSSVTVLSSDDPIRVFEQFATLDNLSRGRAEMIVGRGSYTESFPLFGYDLADYDSLFEEKLDLLRLIQQNNPLTWRGRHRPALDRADVAPRPYRGREIPTWVAVGGTPASAARAGMLGMPMAMGVLGGRLDGFASVVDLYRRTGHQAGVPAEQLRVSVNGPGFVAPTTQEAIDISYPYFARGMMDNFHQRGRGVQMPRRAYEASASVEGALFIGSPAQITDKILRQHEAYGHERYIMQLGYGNTPQRESLRAIELLGTEVLPAVRKALSAGASAVSQDAPAAEGVQA